MLRKENTSTELGIHRRVANRSTGGKEFIVRSVSRIFFTKKQKSTTGVLVWKSRKSN